MPETLSQQIYNYKVYGNSGNPEVIAKIPVTAKYILDVGCGAGDNARFIKNRSNYLVGITISKSEAELAREIFDEVIIADIESADLKLSQKFDVIIMSHICEHLVYPVNAINKLSDFLLPEGIIIIAVPNMAFFKCRLKLMKGDWTLSTSGAFDNTHLHFYSYHSADNLCDTNKLIVSGKSPGELAFPLWPIRKLLPRVCLSIDRFFGRNFPNLFAQQTILTLKLRQVI